MKAKIVICTLVLMFSAFAGSVLAADVTVTSYGTGAGTGGTCNSFYGYNTGMSTTNSYNTFVGNNAGQANVGGYANTFLGNASGENNTSGYYNTFVGEAAGNSNNGTNNTFVGSWAGGGNPTGSSNVFLGKEAGYNETGSNKLYIANSSTATPLIYGDFSSNIVGINGFVGIGTQTPARMLHLVGSNAVFRIDRSVDTAAFQMVRTDISGNPLKVFVVGTNYSPTTGLGEFIINDNGTQTSGELHRRMTMANDGAVTFTGNVTAHHFYSASSLTLKDNVRTYENALDTVNRLRGVSFDWKDSGKPSVGLIAEEVAKVVPEVVAYNDGAVAGVNYASLVGVLVEAVKEQQAIVKELQDKNNRLEQRLLVLEGK